MVVPVHGMFYEHLLSVKVLKRVKGVPFFFCLGRYKSTLDKTQRGWWNAWINERRMVRGRAEKKTIKTKHGRGAIKDRKKNGDILAVCGKAKSIISAFVFIWKGLPQQALHSEFGRFWSWMPFLMQPPRYLCLLQGQNLIYRLAERVNHLVVK